MNEVKWNEMISYYQSFINIWYTTNYNGIRLSTYLLITFLDSISVFSL